MDDDELPHFNNEKEEIKYWRDTALELREKVDELEKELVEFQENSSQLERELEKSLEHADRTNRDLKTKCNRLTLDLDVFREKYEQQCHQSSKQIAELQKEISEYMEKEQKLIKYIRDLEQKNDDLERSERVMLESVGDIEAKLNSAIERNALLENELDEKEMLRTMVQRLKDEQRDMQQELSRQRRQTVPDNNKVIERVRSPVDLNKLSMETQTTPAQMKSKKDKILKRTISAGHSLSCLSNVAEELYEGGVKTTKKLKPYHKKNVNVEIEEKLDNNNILMRKRDERAEKLLPKKNNNVSFRGKGQMKRKQLNNNRTENIGPEQSRNVRNDLTERNNFIYDDNHDFKKNSMKKKSPFAFIKLKSKKKNDIERHSQKIKVSN